MFCLLGELLNGKNMRDRALTSRGRSEWGAMAKSRNSWMEASLATETKGRHVGEGKGRQRAGKGRIRRMSAISCRS